MAFKIVFGIILYIFIGSILCSYVYKMTEDMEFALFCALVWPFSLPIYVGAGIGRDIYNSCHKENK